ncbi:MAG: TRAP transporter large permease [Limnochordia bacterium]|nr:TRAP transporter large permease [Bacillota bacterium]
MALTIFIGFLVLATLGAPIAFAIAMSTGMGIWSQGLIPPSVIVQRMYTSLDSFALAAIPFFLLAGDLMGAGGISRRLINFANALVGHIRNGLAMVNVLTSMFFAGISGSAVADTSAIGAVLIPAMIEEGYDMDFSVVITATSSCIGPIIPPSITMIILGVTADISIGGLFLAGYVPGILIGIALMLMSYFFSGTVITSRGHFSLRQAWTTFQDSFLALIMPLIIIVGIIAGVFTPTEAGAIAALYAFIIGCFVYRELSLEEIPKILLHAAITTAAINFCLAAASVFGWIMAIERIPQLFTSRILALSDNPTIILLLVNLLLLFTGMIMDTTPAILILAPILFPLATKVGLHELHFGIIMAVNLCIGMCTPPYGVCLFVATSIAKTNVATIVRKLIPFVLSMVAVLLLITYVPALPMFLPRLVLGSF